MRTPENDGKARKIGALFTDYDGTIAPSDVSRSESRVPEPTLAKLVELSGRIPIAIITSKDYHFIRPRTEAFANAWACASGLDVVLRGDGRRKSKAALEAPDVALSLRKIEAELPRGVVVERKRSSGAGRRLLGFSIDWTTGPRLGTREVDSITKRLEGDGLFVSRLPWQTYLDAFASRPSKGTALTVLADALGVSQRAVAFLGDSDSDNEAFDKAEVSVGIEHGQPTRQLRCGYLLAFHRLPAFLGSLLENDMVFSPEDSDVRPVNFLSSQSEAKSGDLK
ncbi:MAG: HAD-IIB family hydrolase [Thaumarchaeota archaeon]|nr:HAD-IIB family hydrolase [Nitrososphaerota archaeon]